MKDFESGHKILPGNLKALSGGDKQATRGLWANIDEWRPRFQLRIACNNDLPEFQNNGGGDEGILTRLLMYHFAKRFSEHPRSQNELPLDRSLPAKLASVEWKQQYMLWLLDLYRDYRLAEGFLPAFPQEVKEATDRYKSEVDPLKAFITNHLRLDRDKSDKCYHHKPTALYNQYLMTTPTGQQTLSSDEFFKKAKSFLEDNYRDSGSKRDWRYEGIEFLDCGNITRESFWWTEHTVREYVRTVTEVLPGESSPSWLRSRRFDIQCIRVDLFIEVDGEQHFKSVSRFPGCFRDRQEVDVWKMRQALKRGFSVVRLAQEDAIGDAIDWRSQLTDIISEMKTRRSEPFVRYLARSADLYNAHKALMS